MRKLICSLNGLIKPLIFVVLPGLLVVSCFYCKNAESQDIRESKPDPSEVILEEVKFYIKNNVPFAMGYKARVMGWHPIFCILNHGILLTINFG